MHLGSKLFVTHVLGFIVGAFGGTGGKMAGGTITVELLIIPAWLTSWLGADSYIIVLFSLELKPATNSTVCPITRKTGFGAMFN